MIDIFRTLLISVDSSKGLQGVNVRDFTYGRCTPLVQIVGLMYLYILAIHYFVIITNFLFKEGSLSYHCVLQMHNIRRFYLWLVIDL